MLQYFCNSDLQCICISFIFLYEQIVHMFWALIVHKTTIQVMQFVPEH